MRIPRAELRLVLVATFLAATAPCAWPAPDAKSKTRQRPAAAATEPTFPPTLPGGAALVTDTSEDFLRAPDHIRPGVVIARTPPTVDFAFFPGQTYAGRPWSNWGDSLAVNGKYYASIGDHLAPAGNAFVYEYDPAQKTFRRLVDVRAVLALPEGHYTPGKIHSRLDLGDDGWLYFSTHRGSTRATTAENHYRGDWIIRCNPARGESQVVVCGPVPKHCIPNGMLDPQRLVFYGGTAPGDASDDQGVQFFAYDVRLRKLRYSGRDGPARYIASARSTGRVYYVAGNAVGPLMRYDPASDGPPVRLDAAIGIRAATQETPRGFIYTVSQGQRGEPSMLYEFDTRTEQVRVLGPAGVGTQTYVASLDADPTGRFLYYVPGAHGGSDQDGTPIVQFEVTTGKHKVLAFLNPYYQRKYGCALRGTYSTAVDPASDKLYVTWNVSRGSRAWDCCAVSVVHIPQSER